MNPSRCSAECALFGQPSDTFPAGSCAAVNGMKLKLTPDQRDLINIVGCAKMARMTFDDLASDVISHRSEFQHVNTMRGTVHDVAGFEWLLDHIGNAVATGKLLKDESGGDPK